MNLSLIFQQMSLKANLRVVTLLTSCMTAYINAYMGMCFSLERLGIPGRMCISEE